MRRLSIALVLLFAAAGAAHAQQSVGKVDRLIPAGFINRGSATNEAKKADPVEWNDILRTNDAGRMRVAMDDGSLLSIGAHSELRVIKHDPQSNQTVIEMLYGKARANVVPIKKQGGGFQVRTPTAVIGVLGTTVDVETAQVVGTVSEKELENVPASRRNIADLINLVPGAMPDKSRPDQPTIADYLIDGTLVKARDHSVAVRSIDPEIIEGVVVLPGQWTYVQRGMPPTPPRFGEPQAEDCAQGGCACPQNNCSDFYTNANPQTASKRQPRPELTQSGVRNPAICSYETITLGLQNAISQSGPGHSGQARVILDNVIDYDIVGRGTSTGQVFDVRVKNLTDCPLNIQIPAGSVLEPKGYVGRVLKGILLGGGMPPLKDFQVMMAEGGFGEIPPAQGAGDDYFPGAMYYVPPSAQEVVFTLRGYCLELHKLAPHAKTNYKFADAGDMQKMAPSLKVMETANKLAAMRQLGSQIHSLDSIVQWSLWASREKMNAKEFREEFFKLVKKNYEGQKKKFDKNAKATTEKMVDDLWPLVQKVLTAAR